MRPEKVISNQLSDVQREIVWWFSCINIYSYLTFLLLLLLLLSLSLSLSFFLSFFLSLSFLGLPIIRTFHAEENFLDTQHRLLVRQRMAVYLVHSIPHTHSPILSLYLSPSITLFSRKTVLLSRASGNPYSFFPSPSLPPLLPSLLSRMSNVSCTSRLSSLHAGSDSASISFPPSL